MVSTRTCQAWLLHAGSGNSEQMIHVTSFPGKRVVPINRKRISTRLRFLLFLLAQWNDLNGIEH